MTLAQATVLIAALAGQLQSVSSAWPAEVVARDYRITEIQARPDSSQAAERTRQLVDEIVKASYPELNGADIRVEVFRSKSDYFKARFGIPQFFFGRIRYLVFVNPRVFELQAPPEGLRAILAHELGHVLYYRRKGRVRLLGLARLGSKRFTARFERWADLQAISRGYGPGLGEYRRWLYQNVLPAKLEEKRRNYFSPEEIDAVSSALQKQPALFEYWLKRVPRNLKEIQEGDGSGRR